MPSLPEATSGSLLQQVGSLLDEAVMLIDSDRRIAHWEGGAQRLLGHSPSEVVGHHVDVVVAPGSLERFRSVLDQARTGDRRPQAHLDLLHRDGTEMVFALSARPWIGDSGRPSGLIVVGRDLTTDRRAVERFGSLVAELDQVRAQAQDAEERSRRFLEHAAHQLRTPMACISACVDSMQWGTCPGDSATMVSDLARETARASHLVHSLLRMAHLDQGLLVSPARCDLVELLSEECERAHSLNPTLDIDVRIVYELETEPWIDRHAVREILANLLDNARRHAVAAITIEVNHRPAEMRFRVADDGRGLDPESAERAFERFLSLDGRGGSGLGLPIARAMARAHGGDLVYEPGAFVFWVASSPPPAGELDQPEPGPVHQARVT